MVKKRVADLPILFLDRDGTLIEEGEYLTDPDQVRLLRGVPQALRTLKKAGFPLVVVSNQSGVGRGFITPAELRSVNRRFLKLLKVKKAPIDGLYWCPHRPSAHCSCRKPALGMVKRAARELRRSWKHSISVGDRPSDIRLGHNAGGMGVLVLTGYGRSWRRKSGADYVAKNLHDAARWIIQRSEYGIRK